MKIVGDASKQFVELLHNAIDEGSAQGHYSSLAASELKCFKASEPVLVSTKDGVETYNFRVSASGDMHRESLDTKDYPEGLDSLVELFYTGASMRNAIWGTWNGQHVKSRTYIPPTDFFGKAIEDFTASNGDKFVSIEANVV